MCIRVKKPPTSRSKVTIKPCKIVAVSCISSRVPFGLCSFPTHIQNIFWRYLPVVNVYLPLHNFRLFHAGGHDNGYLPTLTELQNEGLLDKVTLLQGYIDVAAELQSLGLPALRIESLFISEKISFKSPARPPSFVPIRHRSPPTSYSMVSAAGVEAFGQQIRHPDLAVSSTDRKRVPNPHIVCSACSFTASVISCARRTSTCIQELHKSK